MTEDGAERSHTGGLRAPAGTAGDLIVLAWVDPLVRERVLAALGSARLVVLALGPRDPWPTSLPANMPLVLVDQTRPGPQALTQRARTQARLPQARCLLLGAAGEASGDPGTGLRKDFTAGQLRAAVLSALAISHRSLVRPPPVPRPRPQQPPTRLPLRGPRGPRLTGPNSGRQTSRAPGSVPWREAGTPLPGTWLVGACQRD